MMDKELEQLLLKKLELPKVGEIVRHHIIQFLRLQIRISRAFSIAGVETETTFVLNGFMSEKSRRRLHPVLVKILRGERPSKRMGSHGLVSSYPWSPMASFPALEYHQFCICDFAADFFYLLHTLGFR